MFADFGKRQDDVADRNGDWMVKLDPLTASVLPLPQIRSMFDELWQAEGDRLRYFD